MPRRGNRGGQPGRTGTDDQHIAVDVGKKVRFIRHLCVLQWFIVLESGSKKYKSPSVTGKLERDKVGGYRTFSSTFRIWPLVF
jgi:hypothetical protein